MLVGRRSLEAVSAKPELTDLEIEQGKCHFTDLVWQMVVSFYLWSAMATGVPTPVSGALHGIHLTLEAFLLNKQVQRARNLPQSHLAPRWQVLPSPKLVLLTCSHASLPTPHCPSYASEKQLTFLLQVSGPRVFVRLKKNFWKQPCFKKNLLWVYVFI